MPCLAKPRDTMHRHGQQITKFQWARQQINRELCLRSLGRGGRKSELPEVRLTPRTVLTTILNKVGNGLMAILYTFQSCETPAYANAILLPLSGIRFCGICRLSFQSHCLVHWFELFSTFLFGRSKRVPVLLYPWAFLKGKV